MSLPHVIERRVASAGVAMPRASRRRAVWGLAAQHALFAVVPVLFTIWMCRYSLGHHSFAIDFHHEFWPAAQRVLHGLTPYSRTWMNISGGVAFPYPALTALAFGPFALLNHGVADWGFTAVNMLSALLTLWVLNVRDWRLYGLLMILWPVVLAWQAANLTLVLGLGIACLWRKRDHPLVAGALVAVMISLKPFAWPLGLWLLATRRYRALLYAAACGLAVNAVSWAVIGFNQLHAYTQLDAAVNHVMDRRGYSIMSLVMQLGGGRSLAYAIGIAVAALVGVACLIAGRRGNAKAALALCVAVCLLATPVLWTHYFALLIVPLALYRPRLDRVWLLMLLFYACPGDGPRVWQIAVALATTAIVVGLLLYSPGPPASLDRRGVGTGRMPELAGSPKS
jgi:alpha-1,2-mannosyltransferase